MNRPWFQMYSRDWLDNKELRRCSPAARAVLADLMCLAHEGVPYGHLADKIGPLTVEYMASRCIMAADAFLECLGELKNTGRIVEKDTVLAVPRMIRDEEIRLRRAQGGKLGGNPTIPPAIVNEVNLPPNLTPPLHFEPKGGVECEPRSESKVNLPSDSVYGSAEPSLVLSLPKIKTSRFSEWFDGFRGRKADPNGACQAWLSVDADASVDAAFACRDRYNASREVAEGVVMEAARFIFQQGRNGWTGDWPMPREPTSPRMSSADRVKALAIRNLERTGRIL